MRKKKVTLKDIAAKTDLSVATVSRALRNNGSVSESTRQHVFRVAQNLGVATHEIAKGGKLGKVSILILDSGWGAFFEKCMREVVRQSKKRNFEVEFHRSERYESVREGLTRVANQTEGVVVLGTWDALGEEEADLINALQVPTILVNRYIGACANAVTLDDFGTGLAAARFLVGLGHKRIAYLPGIQSSSSMRDRMLGFRTGLEKNGLFNPELFTEPLHGNILVWTCNCVKQLMSLPQPPTAIWTCNDIVASAVIVSLKTQGINIPEQVSVIGHDRLPQTHNIGLTTFDHRFTELGYNIAMLAEGILKKELSGGVHISVMPELIEGNTTGPAPTY